MGERYIAYDVETPNRANDRISAIGISVIEGGTITNTFYLFVNPEALTFSSPELHRSRWKASLPFRNCG